MRNIFTVLGIAIVLTASCFPVSAQAPFADLSITNYQFISEQRVTRDGWYVTYRADLVNTGNARGAITATVSSTAASVQILPGQGTVHFPAVVAGGRVTSLDTFTISVDRTVPFDFNSLHWSFVNPLANAGPNQTTPVGSTVTLNGSGSTNPSGVGTLTYSWTMQSAPPGSHATIVNPNSVTATFVKDLPGVNVVQLTVSNGVASDTALTTITTLNSAPVANAGPDQSVAMGRVVTLNGSASTDVDGDPLTYAWRFVSLPPGSVATLIGINSLFPTFVVDKPGTYIIQLIVNDGKVNSQPSTVNVTTVNTPPVANAGPGQLVTVNALVQLNGAGSTDVDGNPLTYRWSLLTVPTGSPATLSSTTTVNPTFTADHPGTYVAQLIVNDGTIDSAPSTVTIATNSLQAPTANAGNNQTIGHGIMATLNGSGTDPQGLPLTFNWALTSIPAGSKAVLSGTNVAHPTFIPDIPGPYIAQLIVDNGFLHSAPAITIVTTTNTAPVANAGSNQGVFVGSTVTLDGGNSQDADHDPLTYSWSFLSRPTNSTGALSSPTAKSPSFVTDLAGTYILQLIVNDGFTNSSPATVTITASTMTITLSPNPLTVSNLPGILTVTINPPAGSAGLTVALSGYDHNVISLPASVTVPPNSTGVNATVTPLATGSTNVTASASGYQPGAATVNVTTLSISVSLSQSSVALTNSVNGTVTLSAAAPAGGVSVALSATPPGLISFSPATVTIAQNNTTGTFQITGLVTGNTTITASSTGYTSGTTPVQVTNQAAISVASGVTVPAGQSAPLGVSLSAPAANNVTITLTSSDTSVLTVPASITILQGATTPTTPPQVTGVGIGSATVTGAATGFSSDTKTVKSTGSLSFSTQVVSVGAGGVRSINLLLSAPAPTGGLPVTLSSDNTAFATVPANLQIAAGATSVPFNVTGVAVGSANISASTTNPNVTGATASVTVTASSGGINLPTGLTVSPGATVPFPISLAAISQSSTFIELKTSDSSIATISPSQVVVAAGQTQPSIPATVTGVASGTVTITASSAGSSLGPVTTQVTVAFSATLTPSPLQITGNGVHGTLTLTLSAPAPASGLTFNLSSSNTGVATTLPTVTLTPGLTSIGFFVTSVSAGSAVIRASAANIPDATANVTVQPPGSITLNGPATVALSQSGNLTVGLSIPAPPTGLTVDLTTTDPNIATVTPASVNIPPGATAPTTQPQVNGILPGTVGIVASGTAFTSSPSLTVNVNATVTWTSGPLTIDKAGNTGTVRLRLNGAPPPGFPQTQGVLVNLSSSDPNVATIQNTTIFFWDGSTAPSHDLQVTAVGPGTATLHASGTNIPDVTMTVTVLGGFAITTASLPSGTISTAYSATVSATGGTNPLTWSATGLPANLSINSSTGQITGTPTAAGTSSVTINVTDATTPTHLTASKTLSLTINGSGVSITTASLANGTVGATYSAPMAASGGVTPYTWSATGLPNGLGIDSASGQITGTPTAAGTSSVNITVTDATTPTHLTASKTLSLTIGAASGGISITTAALPAGVLGVGGYTAQMAATGGTTPYTWSATGLPNALAIDPATGQITGTPVATGTFSVTITVTDATTPTHLTGSKTLSLVVNSQLSITTSSLNNGGTGVAYSSLMAASGGTTPYTWTATGLANGLTIDSATGQITGTPLTQGTTTAFITVTDSTTPTHLSQTRNYSITITPGVAITTASLANGFVGTAYSAPVAATGGTTPYSFSATGLPTGLNIDSASGQITGTPTATGTSSVNITVSDSTTPTHFTSSKTLSLTINPGVTITTAALASAFTGVAYSAPVAATGGTTPYTWSATGLPTGLAIDPASGQITGTTNTSGSNSVTITVTDATTPTHLTASKTLSLSVFSGVGITTTSLASGFTGVAYSAPVAATGGTTPYTWSATGLPTGLGIDPASGQITGTATATGTSSVNITVTDSTTPTHLTASKTLSLTINAGLSITTTSLANGFTGAAYSAPVAAAGGTAPYTWSATGLPTGLGIDAATGQITGTATATGTSSVNITVTDATTPTHLTASKTLSLTINAGLSCSTNSLPNAPVGVAYSAALVCTGGTPPYAWSVTGLPIGLGIDPVSGQITGTPTATGTSSVTVTVTDSTTPTHLTVSKTLSLTVFTGVGITTNSLAIGFTGVAYSAAVAASGGTTPYTWSASGLPGGLGIDAATGQITGTPTATGTSSVLITVTDSTAPTHLTASKTLSLTINAGLSITTSSLATGFTGAAYTAPVAATGGTTPYTWSATGLPTGLAIDAATGQITGTATATGTSSVNITVTDATTPTHLTASKTLSLTINAGVSITTTSLATGFTGAAYTAPVAATGGTTPYTWSATGLPTGLGIDSATGQITGTPTATGTSSVNITVTDATTPTHLTASKTLSLTVNAGLSITTTSLATGFTGTAYSAPVAATGGTTPYTWSATGLPTGLGIDAATGQITGTPTATGTNSVNITVTDATTPTHLTASKTLSLTVNAGLSITTTSLAAGFTFTTYTTPLAATGGNTPYAWSATGLPTGLAIDAATGQITGTPAATGTSSVVITVTDATTPTHLTASKTLTLTVSAGLSITTTSLVNGLTGTPYSAPVAATGGTAPYAWSATGLPTGLAINPTTGQITGTPTATGVSSVAITVTDATTPTHLTASKTLSLTVTTGFGIITNSLATGFTGVNYTTPVAATGGTTPYTWSATGLPTGLNIDPNTGQITGTPIAALTSNVTITATDSTTPTHLTASKTLPLTINLGLSVTTASPLPSGFAGVAYSATVVAAGGTAPYTWSATGLPASLAINPSTGVISGTPAATGTSTVTVTVTDATTSTPLTAAATLSLTINPGLSITTSSPLAAGSVGTAYTATIAAAGGTSPYTWTAANLPGGLSININTGQITGTPTASGTSANVNITATDATTPSHLTVSKTFSITIAGMSITTTALPPQIQGSPYSLQLTSTGGKAPLTWSATGLPSNLVLDPATGIISGTPVIPGFRSISIDLSDSSVPAQHASTVLQLSIVPLPLAISAVSPRPNALINTPYSDQLTASGGITPYIWTAINLPAGFTMSANGTVSSASVPLPLGQFTYTATVTDSSPGQTQVSKQFVLNVTQFSVQGVIGISNVTIGLNLQKSITITLTPPPTIDTDLTLTSSNGALVQLGTSSNSGAPQITATIPAGTSSVSTFVKAFGSSGTATIQGSAASYTNGSGTVTLANTGFVLSANNTIGGNVTTTQGSSTTLTVSAYALDPAGNLVESQPVRGGFSIGIPISSSSPAVGDVAASLLTLSAGLDSATVNFQAAITGNPSNANTTVSVQSPFPYALPATGSSIGFTVQPSGFVLPSGLTIGKNLQVQTQVNLKGPAPTNLLVTVQSLDTSRLQFSRTATGVSSPSVSFTIDQGTTNGSVMFARAFDSTGSASFTVSAPGFGSVTGSIAFGPSGVVLHTPGGYLLNFTTSPGFDATLDIYSGRFTTSGTLAELQQVAGDQSISATVTSSNPSVGTITQSPVTITGGSSFATTFFHPLQAGASLISTSATGYTGTSASANVVVPNLSIDDMTVGNLLQGGGTLLLTAPAPSGGLDVTLSGGGGLLKFAPLPAGANPGDACTAAGSTSLTIHVNQNVSSAGYCVYALSSAGTAAYTATATGYNPRTATITFARSGIVIFGPGFCASCTATASGPTIPLTLFTAVLLGTPTPQALAGGAALSVSLSNTNNAAGTVPNSVSISPGTGTPAIGGAVFQFTPGAAGSTTVSPIQPSGMNVPSTFTQVVVTVQ